MCCMQKKWSAKGKTKASSHSDLGHRALASKCLVFKACSPGEEPTSSST